MIKDALHKMALVSVAFVVEHFAKLVCFLAGLALGMVWF